MLTTITNGNDLAVQKLVKDNVTYFVSKDLTGVLGLAESSIRNKFKQLDNDEKLKMQIFTGGRMREVNLVTAEGLSTMILSCPKSRQKNTMAWRYRRWVVHEVLPSIRETGRFELQNLKAQLALKTTQCEDAVRQRDVLQGEKDLLLHNRLHKIAYEVAPQCRNRYNLTIRFQQNKSHLGIFVWKEGTCFVKPGAISYVKCSLRGLLLGGHQQPGQRLLNDYW